MALQSSTVLTGVGVGAGSPFRSCVTLGEGLSLDPSFLSCEVWIIMAALSSWDEPLGGGGSWARYTGRG